MRSFFAACAVFLCATDCACTPSNLLIPAFCLILCNIFQERHANPGTLHIIMYEYHGLERSRSLCMYEYVPMYDGSHFVRERSSPKSVGRGAGMGGYICDVESFPSIFDFNHFVWYCILYNHQSFFFLSLFFLEKQTGLWKV